MEVENDFILVRNLATPEEINELTNLSFGSDVRSTFREHWYQFYTYDKDIIQKRDDILLNIYERLMEKFNSMYPDKVSTLNQINNLFKDIKNGKNEIFGVAYYKSHEQNVCMSSHYDVWSDWNMVVSAGESTTLHFARSKFEINHGDVYLFNGNHKLHSVSISPTLEQLLGKRNTFLSKNKKTQHLHRICLQLRRPLKKSKIFTKRTNKIH